MFAQAGRAALLGHRHTGIELPVREQPCAAFDLLDRTTDARADDECHERGQHEQQARHQHEEGAHRDPPHRQVERRRLVLLREHKQCARRVLQVAQRFVTAKPIAVGRRHTLHHALALVERREHRAFARLHAAHVATMRQQRGAVDARTSDLKRKTTRIT